MLIYHRCAYIHYIIMEFDCFVKTRHSSVCGIDRGKEEWVHFVTCNDDISGHLSGCHLSREILSEHELILARCGLFDIPKDHLENMKICPKHRNMMGKYWRPLRTCQYPEHKGKATRHLKGSHVVSLQNAKDIQGLFGKTVSIGSRK